MTALAEAHAAGPTEPVLPAMTVGDLLRRAARESPTHPALRAAAPDGEPERAWNYAGLFADSERCARQLLELFDPGERLAVWADNRPEWIILQFGAALAGLVLVTVNPAFRTAEARHVLKHSRAAGCFVVHDYRGAPLATTARELQTELGSLRHVIDIDEWDGFHTDPAGAVELPPVESNDPVLIQYTSGTTGFPKGALLRHASLTTNAEQVTRRAGLRTHSAWLAPLPLFHTGGCVVAVLGAVSRQATIVLMSAWSAQPALQLVEREHIEIINAVPTMLIGMMRHPEAQTRDLSSLRCVLAGAAPVSAAIVRELQSRLALNVYIIFGQTECGPVATMTNIDDTPEDKQNTVGTLMPGFEAKIVDPDTGRTVRPGELGEFIARGRVMAGYFEDEDANKLAFDDGGWLHTGDLCAMDERGYLRVEGRLRDMIIRGGENVYPREVEELLLDLDSIDDAAVVGLPDDEKGEVVGAFVVPSAAAVFDTTLATEQLRNHLARFKLPEQWIVIDELPRTATGKVQKYVLRTRWKSGELTDGDDARHPDSKG